AVAELLAVALVRILVLQEAMQEGGVRRVDADLHRLQPVAFPQPLECKDMALGRGEAVERREGRRLAGAHIGEDESVLLNDGIRDSSDVFIHMTAFGLRRLLDALTGTVEVPAVERAAQAVVLASAVAEVGAAMRTVTADESK